MDGLTLALTLAASLFATPALDLKSTACDFERASLRLTDGAQACPGAADWAALSEAVHAEQGPTEAPAAGKKKPPRAADTLRARLGAARAAAERARNAPGAGVVEEAYVQALDRALRAPPSKGEAKGKGKALAAATPESAWALPGAPIPAPALPNLRDEQIDAAREAYLRSAERLAELRGRLAPDAPEGMRKAVERGFDERRLLLGKLTEAIEDALQKDPKFSKTAWLHLAACYFELDRDKPAPERRTRGVALLERLIAKAPQDSAAALAGLWLAGDALSVGDLKRAATLAEDGATVEPDLAALYGALADWRAGDGAGAEGKVAQALKHPDPAARAQAQALAAELKASKAPLDAAQHWDNAATALWALPAPEAEGRARLRASAAWADGVLADATAIVRVPPEKVRDVSRVLAARGEPALAVRSLFAALDADPLRIEVAADLLAALEVLASVDEGAADAALADLARRLLGDGPFQKTHGADPAGQALRGAIGERILGRIGAPLAAGLPLDDEARARLAPLVEARLTLIPPAADDRLATARALSLAGFGDRAATIVRDVRDNDADPGRRQAAARTLVELALLRARAAGEAGEPVGAFLDGGPTQAAMPPAVRALVDAQTALAQMLKPGEERDRLFLEHAAVRVAFRQGDQVQDALQGIIERHEHDELGLRAGLLILRTGAAERRTRDATLFTRKRLGPPERETELRALWTKSLEGVQIELDASLMAQRLFDRAAGALEAQAAQAGAAAAKRDAFRLAAATGYAMAFRIPEALAAVRAFLNDAPQHALAGEARALLVRLLLELDERPAAAALAAEIAQADAARAPDMLALLADLHSAHPARLRPVLERLVQAFPARLPDAQVRLARLGTAPSAKTERVPPGRGVFFGFEPR